MFIRLFCLRRNYCFISHNVYKVYRWEKQNPLTYSDVMLFGFLIACHYVPWWLAWNSCADHRVAELPETSLPQAPVPSLKAYTTTGAIT